MLKVTNHPRDANQNNNEVPSHTCQNGYHQQISIRQVLERMWGKRNPLALLVGMQTAKLKMELPFVPGILLQGIYPKKPKTLIRKDICTPMFIAAQFTIAKIGKQPKCPSADEWIKKNYGSSIQWNIIQL